jgi:hypothetical protein
VHQRVIQLTILFLFAASVVKGSQNTAQQHATSEDIYAVREMIIGALGDSVCTKFVEYTRSNSKHGDLPSISCFVEYSFTPAKLVSESILLRFVHQRHESWELEYQKNLPNCAKSPSLCDVNITRDQAIDIARACALSKDVMQYDLQLIVARHQLGFYWKFLGELDIDADNRTTNQEYLLIDAVTGKPDEVMTEMTIHCGGG